MPRQQRSETRQESSETPWRGIIRQSALRVGTGNEARGTESQEFPFRRQSARRPYRRHSRQPYVHLSPAPGRSATLPHPTAHEPALLASARSRRLAPRPVETPPRRSPRQAESAQFHRLRQPHLSHARVAPVLNVSLTNYLRASVSVGMTPRTPMHHGSTFHGAKQPLVSSTRPWIGSPYIQKLSTTRCAGVKNPPTIWRNQEITRVTLATRRPSDDIFTKQHAYPRLMPWLPSARPHAVGPLSCGISRPNHGPWRIEQTHPTDKRPEAAIASLFSSSQFLLYLIKTVRNRQSFGGVPDSANSQPAPGCPCTRRQNKMERRSLPR